MPALKTIDSKGRVTLGREFAGQSVQVEPNADGLVLRFYTAVPVREAWLWNNESALAKVDRGLSQLAKGELSNGPPDLADALAFADSLPDE